MLCCSATYISFNELEEAISGVSGIQQSRKHLMRAFRIFQDKDARFGYIRKSTLEAALDKHCNAPEHSHTPVLDRIVSQSEHSGDDWLQYIDIVEALVGSDAIQNETMT